MKKIFIFLMLSISILSFGKDGKQFVGKWITEKAENGNQIIVNIFEQNGKFFGQIEDLTLPLYEKGHKFEGQPKMDLANPDEKLKTKPLVGRIFVSSFSYDGEGKFTKGSIYNPENGKTYHCTMTAQKDGTLLVKGSLDSMGLIGKKQIWTKYNK